MDSEQSVSHRPLTKRQYSFLLALGSGAMLVSGGKKRDWDSMLNRGLVTGELGAQGCYVNGVRITAAGLRALADAVDRYGLPEFRSKGTRS